MDIRSVRLNDALQIAELSSQLGYPAEVEHVRIYLGQIIQDVAHSFFVTDDRTGLILGWVHVFKTKRVFKEPFAEVGGLIVDENNRGKGVGQQLINEAEEWARQNECPTMLIRTNVIRTDSHAFYLDEGYSLLKQQKVFKKELT